LDEIIEPQLLNNIGVKTIQRERERIYLSS